MKRLKMAAMPLLIVILFLAFIPEKKAWAGTNENTAILEIAPNHLKGSIKGKGQIKVDDGTIMLGSSLWAENSTFSFPFTIKDITPGTELHVHIQYDSGLKQKLAVTYQPPVLQPVNAKDRTLSGTSRGEVTATAGGTPLQLQSHNRSTGEFIFKPSNALMDGAEITAASTQNHIKSVTSSIVGPAPNPRPPIIFPASAHDPYIRGTAPSNSMVYVTTDTGVKKQIKLGASRQYKVYAGMLEPGAYIAVYYIDEEGSRSPLAGTRVKI
ncbi:hypothetical protein V1498_20830 [Peribacillus sp. SCS-26]|uniref:hypothetical protein n=1 Tax=Paraperibacillus marinus TaxID=3115295 RepID=UPI003905C69F